MNAATTYWADRPHKMWQVKATIEDRTEVIAVITAEDETMKDFIVDALNARAAATAAAAG